MPQGHLELRPSEDWASVEYASELSQPSGEEAGIFTHQISIWYWLRVALVAVTLVHVWLILLDRQTEALSEQPSACREDYSVADSICYKGINELICNTGQAPATKQDT